MEKVLNLLKGGSKDNDPDPVTGLTNVEKELIKNSWSLVKKDLKGHGIELFLIFFKDFPEYQNFFPFRDVPYEELRTNNKLRSHGVSVMYAIGAIVDNLDDNDVLIGLLEKNGESHGKRKVTAKHYWSSLTRLNELNQLTSIPLRVDFSQLNDGTRIFNALKSNRAVYHKSCRANCSENRIARAQKRSEQKSLTKFSPKKTRQSSGTFDKNKCIFCATDTPSNQPLYRVGDKKVSASIVQYAKIFNDGKLLARSFKSTQDNKEDRPESLSEVHAYALALLITHINKVKEDKANCSPVFKMSDLAKLYSSFMKDMGVDHIAHSSRLRDRLLNACSYLQSLGKIGEDCLITFQDDLYEVMRSASRHYDLEAKQYCDVAKVLRKDIFDCGSSSWEQELGDQNSCTPLSLRTFLKMLLRGPGNISSAGEEQSEAEQHGDDQHDDQVISTLSQLICYHTQKKPPRFWAPSTPLSAIRKARSSIPGHENFWRNTEQKTHSSSPQTWTEYLMRQTAVHFR
ncbi:hypothetical protein FQA39_LY08238 [Lamprigera yunnana]|nr:hypothetical protein FQA39_LY08238 [Lamprigera yunnana]